MNFPAMRETQVQSLCQEDPLEKGMAIHSNILAWRILWTEEPGGLQSMEPWGCKESDMTEQLAVSRAVSLRSLQSVCVCVHAHGGGGVSPLYLYLVILQVGLGREVWLQRGCPNIDGGS